MAETQRIALGLDIGTTKVAMAVVAQKGESDFEILGFSEKPCRSLHQGVIVNLEKLTVSVSECIQEIKSLIKIPFKEVTLNVPACELKCVTGDGQIEFKKKRDIKRLHVQQVLNASVLASSDEWTLVHTFPIEFIVDGQGGIFSPVGMAGKILEVRMQQIFAPRRMIDNLIHSVQKCKLQVVQLVADPLSHMEALVTPDEMQLGVVIVNIGGSHTTIGTVHGRQFKILTPLNYGGDLVTSDIAIGLRTSIRDAEKVKIKYGRAVQEFADESQKIRIPALGGGSASSTITSALLSEIIHPRVDEIIDLAAKSFHSELNANDFTSGVILTGGTSVMPGVSEIAEKHFQMPITLGNLRQVGGLTSIASPVLMAGATGLALYQLRNPRSMRWKQNNKNGFHKFFNTISSWLGGGQVT